MIFNVKINNKPIFCGDFIYTSDHRFKLIGLMILDEDFSKGYKYLKELEDDETFTITIGDIYKDNATQLTYMPKSINFEGCRVKYFRYRLRDECVDVFGEYEDYNVERH